MPINFYCLDEHVDQDKIPKEHHLKQLAMRLKSLSLQKNTKPLCLFITGTDTNVGKTYCSVKLLKALNLEGLNTVGLKPVASGALLNPASDILENEDALNLQKAASISLPYAEINPIIFEPAIAPHIAAALKGETLSAQDLFEATQKIIQKFYPSTSESPETFLPNIILIEGAGGWNVPLQNPNNPTETMADYVELLAKHVDLKIILVIGMKLGCLNHAILTLKAIQDLPSVRNQTADLIGVIANSLEEKMPYFSENCATIEKFLV